MFGGRIDMELSPRGHQQARALSRYFQGQKLDAVYASPMRRVHQTIASVLLGGSLKSIVLEDLREVDFGDWTGLHWNEIQAKFGKSAFTWLHELECAGIPNAECSKTLRSRVEPCLRQLLEKHSGQRVAVFCHGGVIRMALAILLNWQLPALAALEIDYASVTQVLWTPSAARLQFSNFTPWRELQI